MASLPAQDKHSKGLEAKHRSSVHASHPAAPGSILRVSESFSRGILLEKLIQCCRDILRPCLEASAVLASSKFVLEKKQSKGLDQILDEVKYYPTRY